MLGVQLELRETFVTDLLKDILGPRKGLREPFDGSPLVEYVTGVLAPVESSTSRDPDAESEIPFDDSQTYDEDADDVDFTVPPLLSPALHPQKRPPSIGLSFAVERSVEGISVCLTWSKYERSSSARWTREPKFSIQTVPITRNGVVWIGPDGKLADQSSAEISLNVLVKTSPQGSRVVSLFLVNRTKFTPKKPEDKPRTEHHIFQPQIRVAIETQIVPWTNVATLNDEDRELNMLYSKRPILARGHLCSAVWESIDPERPFHGHLDFPEAKLDPPFKWIDGELLTESERGRFSPAAVRTEFVPLYSIPVPDLGWRSRKGVQLSWGASVLAETWNSERLKALLDPLWQEYEDWIQDKRRQIDDNAEPQKAIALRLISIAESVRDRIKRGITVISSDEDSRLSFCFANKALDTQWRWTHKDGLQWRPFQMAFILMTLESIVNPKSPEREICDLLWVPTGGGKTEAYLALAAMAFGYRRRRAVKTKKLGSTGAGVCVITRYTLRLLTIQQFRRALGVVTAAEALRVHGMAGTKVGWRPDEFNSGENFLWGSTPFSIGLWVGGAVTPNKLQDGWGGNHPIPGALTILGDSRITGEGEPAQVLACPCCQSILSIPSTGLAAGKYKLHFVVRATASLSTNQLPSAGSTFVGFVINGLKFCPHSSRDYFTITFDVSLNKRVSPSDVDSFWVELRKTLDAELVSTRASRPGYFYRWLNGPNGRHEPYDFQIMCPNPDCQLRTLWVGGEPSGSIIGDFQVASKDSVLPDGNQGVEVLPAFSNRTRFVSERIPIPALTVDDQLYRHMPTIVIATVDKFARPPFEPRASAFFGNVSFHHPIWGYYRPHLFGPNEDNTGHPKARKNEPTSARVRINQLDPPDLVLQDELHLVEGPLGSLVGIYESAIEYLCRERSGVAVKYLASTATVRRAAEQVQAVFSRKLQIFPPHVLSSDDRFYVLDRDDAQVHPLDDSAPGRLYLGVAGVGRGPLTPIVRIWARLLQTGWLKRNHPEVDGLWTLTGYFNAIRELAGVRALYRQDIQERLRDIGAGNPRPTPPDRCQELSSVTDSVELPAILDLMNAKFPDAQDSVLTTSMFGTGVDIPRIGLMVVHGQPKTTSAYIQSTGRVGRSKGGLVVTFLRSTRPRDLNHYEYFSGYHRQLHRFVEPITVYPFAPGVIDRAGGPVVVFMLRNKSQYQIAWCDPNSANLMGANRTVAPEVKDVVVFLDTRATNQPRSQASSRGEVKKRLDSKLDIWQNVARRRGTSLQYVEYAISSPPKDPVVLGDAQHVHFRLEVVYYNAPQSLRDIEETLGFET